MLLKVSCSRLAIPSGDKTAARYFFLQVENDEMAKMVGDDNRTTLRVCLSSSELECDSAAQQKPERICTSLEQPN